MSLPLQIVVVGAGAFGGWTALELQRRGARVTLIDAWGPGHARASSGGETRIIRATYGTRAIYTKMALRALDLWRAFDVDRQLLHETGVLWMFDEDASFGHASARVLADHGATLDELTVTDAARRYPHISFDGIRSAFFEPAAGYLYARRACEEVVNRFRAEGGHYACAAVATPVQWDHPRSSRLKLTDGSTLEADAFVFACGPWLASLFPRVIGDYIRPTRQPVLYFGTPPGITGLSSPELPVWMDFAAGSRSGQIYGIPGACRSGFKVADDQCGAVMDPSTADRVVHIDEVDRVRAFLARRFPALADAPLVAAEVCQYECTPDDHFIIDRHPDASVDRHPDASPVWIVGGGSGHGYKMGPALGEMVASHLLDGTEPDAQFSLSRFGSPPQEGWQTRWS